MAEKYVYCDEEYPVYVISDIDAGSKSVEIPDELIARYEKAEEERSAVQKLLIGYYKLGRPSRK
jgi:hypothetical protein